MRGQEVIRQDLRGGASSDKMRRDMLAVNEIQVPLPVTPFVVLGAMFVASLAVFLWITRKH